MLVANFICYYFTFKVGYITVVVFQVFASLIMKYLFKSDDFFGVLLANLASMTIVLVPAHVLIRQAILRYAKQRAALEELEKNECTSSKQLLHESATALFVLDNCERNKHEHDLESGAGPGPSSRLIYFSNDESLLKFAFEGSKDFDDGYDSSSD